MSAALGGGHLALLGPGRPVDLGLFRSRMSSAALNMTLAFTDRDFTEDDYEMLLRLDEGVGPKGELHKLPRL